MDTTLPPSHPLSTRALKWLSTLERRSAVPVAEVESLILDAGLPCFDVWLDFHERYAGFVEPIGLDQAVWGLIHAAPSWLSPMRPEFDREPDEDTWYIACADAHPSYDYSLDNRGEFVGAPAESFDVIVERNALGWEFRQRGSTRALTGDELRGENFRQVFEKQIRPFLVPEASDKHSRYYLSPQYLLVENATTGDLRRGRAYR